MAKDDSATPAVLATTNKFAVSATPVHYTVSFHAPLVSADELGPARGMIVFNQWSSDSGEIQDLDGVFMNEGGQRKRQCHYNPVTSVPHGNSVQR
jgi:hypothetical protein